jgi:hypothetical protein
MLSSDSLLFEVVKFIAEYDSILYFRTQQSLTVRSSPYFYTLIIIFISSALPSALPCASPSALPIFIPFRIPISIPSSFHACAKLVISPVPFS